MVTLGRDWRKMGLNEVDRGGGELEIIDRSVVLIIENILGGKRGKAYTTIVWTNADRKL
jgi:hypothetical protein